MKYVLVFLVQIVLCQGAGLLFLSLLGAKWQREFRSFLTCQLVGILVISAYLTVLLALGVPRSRSSVALLAVVLAGLSLVRNWSVVRQFKWSGSLGHSRRKVTLVDVLFLFPLLALCVFWLASAFVMVFDLVPTGDGQGWIGISLRWAYQTPFVASDRPPLTNAVEGLNFILSQGKDANGALLATWWLHVLALLFCGKLMQTLSGRWAAIVLLFGISLSFPFVKNMGLGYRDALVAKWVVATLLSGIVFAFRPGKKDGALLLGLLFSATALIKHEGLVYGFIAYAVSVSVSLVIHLRRGRARGLVSYCYLVGIPAAVIGGWWLTRVCCLSGGVLIRDFHTLGMSQFTDQLFDAGRHAAVLSALARSPMQPLYGLSLVALFAGAITPRMRVVSLVSAMVLVLSVAFVLVAYMATPLDLDYHLNSSFDRLMFTPWAVSVAIVCICGFGALRRDGSPQPSR